MDFDFARLATPIEADWPVTICEPIDGGKVLEQKLMVRFRLVDEKELSALGDGLEASKETLRRVVVGFGKGVSEPFSSGLLETMLDKAFIRYGLNNAYRSFALGIEEKN